MGAPIPEGEFPEGMAKGSVVELGEQETRQESEVEQGVMVPWTTLRACARAQPGLDAVVCS